MSQLSSHAVQPVPNLDARYRVTGWSPDGKSLLVFPAAIQKTAKVYRVDIKTGKIEFWKEFGASLAKEAVFVARPVFATDGQAYVYVYDQVLSESYVVKGLR